MRKPTLLAWSGGKDSAWALHRLRGHADIEVAGLFTTVNEPAGRIAVHEVPLKFLYRQAEAAGVPLHTLPIPSPCPNEDYERVVGGFLEAQKAKGITHVAFGDLFLADIRRYRERQLGALGLEPLFPLWGLDTAQLAREMTAGGLKAWITCVDLARAPREWAGRCFDAGFVEALPAGIDPCGENGEFHTFVFDGPRFARPVAHRVIAVHELRPTAPAPGHYHVAELAAR